jgi:hypothetical protein
MKCSAGDLIGEVDCRIFAEVGARKDNAFVRLLPEKASGPARNPKNEGNTARRGGFNRRLDFAARQDED